MLLNDADKVYVGSTAADKVYLGSNLVWEPASTGEVPWTPALIPTGMYGWWDPSIAGSLTFSGANLTAWADHSAAGHNLSRYLASGPTATTLNGLGALAFAGGQGMASAAAQFDDFTVCAVFKPGPTVPGYERVIDHVYETGWWLGRTGGTQTWGGGVLDGPATQYGRFVSLADNQAHQISSKREGTTHTISGNGGAALLTATVSAARTGAAGVHFGDDGNGTSPMAGTIAEVLVWSRALSASDMAKTEGYLAWKWGIQAKLPAGHPYKASAPGTIPPVTAPKSHLLVSYTPGTDRNDFGGQVGVRLGIGGANLTVAWLGMRRHHVSQTGDHTVKLYEWFADKLERTVTVDPGTVAVGEYVWGAIAPYTLLASGYYTLLLDVVGGDGRLWCNPGPAAFAPSIANAYDVYRVGAGAATAGTPSSMYNGLDLGSN